MKPAQVAVVMSGFPRCSETFALGELLALEKRGLLAAIFATKAGDGAPPQPGCEPLLSRVRFLPDAPPVVQARALVELLDGQPVSGIHGYFAHAPAEVAQAAARRLGVPFGFSTHARDARKVASDQLGARVRAAACVIACNSDVATEIARYSRTVHLLPHGVDLERFQPRPFPRKGPLQLLAVGRLVEKKGFDALIAAVAQLNCKYHLHIIGEGPQRERLEKLITAAGLQRSVTLCGLKTHAELPEAYATADAVIVPSIIDSTGDRDGLPNVVLEAMASARPVIASRVSAIVHAVTDEVTGLLVPPAHPAALAAAIERLEHNPAFKAELGQRARARVEADFEIGRCGEQFCNLLEKVYV